MNVYEFAMQMEKDGEAYYRLLSKGCPVLGLANIFSMLADEEVKHFKVIEGLSRNESNLQLSETRILDNVKKISPKIKEIFSA